MHDIFRDPTEGALARRSELLRRRREELATLPHAVRRVVVARSARIAGGVALAIGGALLVAATVSPAISHGVRVLLPGDDPAPLATLLLAAWIAGLAAYAFGSARAEHRFAVRMSRAVLPGDDLDHDLERLSHERPDELARRGAHGLEIGSIAWPVLGAAAIGPATLIYALHAVRACGWPSVSGYEDALAAHALALVGIGVAGIAVAGVTTRPFARRPGAAVAAAVVAFVAAPGLALPLAVALPCIAAVALATTIAWLAWRLDRERGAIAAEDPAAGAQVITLRLVASHVRRALGAIAALAGRRRWVGVAAIGAGVLAVGFGVAFGLASRPAPAPAPRVSSLADPRGTPAAAAPAANGAQAPATATLPGGVYRVELALPEDHGLALPGGIGGLEVIPAGWQADVEVRRTDREPGALDISPFPGHADFAHLAAGQTHVFHAVACHRPALVQLVVAPPPGGHAHAATLEIHASLTLASCF